MYDFLITCISWEERCLVGVQRDIESFNISNHVFLLFNTYKEEKQSNVNFFYEKYHSNIVELDFNDPINIWQGLKSKFYLDDFIDKKILVDISTMTREMIWLVLLFLNSKTKLIDFIYHKPYRYGAGLLSYNPIKPRLIYKMSGISDSSKSTMLIVTAGYDFERIDALKYKFEPAKVLILYDFNNNFRQEVLDELKRKYAQDELININASDTDSLFYFLRDIIDKNRYTETYNIVCASLGPKSTAISIFKLWKQNPEIALCYTPSKNYNMDYSRGIGNYIKGKI